MKLVYSICKDVMNKTDFSIKIQCSVCQKIPPTPMAPPHFHIRILISGPGFF